MAAACNAAGDDEQLTTSELSSDLLEAQIVAQAITELQEIQAPRTQASTGTETTTVEAGTTIDGDVTSQEDPLTHIIYYIENGTIARTEDRTLVDSAVQANDYDIERRSGRLPARKRVIPVKFRDYKNASDDNTSDSDYEPPEQKPKINRAPRTPGTQRPKPDVLTSQSTSLQGNRQGRGRPRKNFMPTQVSRPGGNVLNPVTSELLEKKYQEALQMLPEVSDASDHGETDTGNGSVQGNLKASTDELVHDKSDANSAAVAVREGINKASIDIEGSTENEGPVESDGQTDEEVRVGTRRSRVPRENKDPSYEYSLPTVRRGRGRPRGETWLRCYKCPDCGKIFNQKGNLRVHLLVHTSERPFPCNEPDCGRAFRSNESLRRHLLSHQGIKPFECDICHNKFSSNVALTEHRSRHFDEKPHSCPHCDRRFRQVSCLRRHIATHSSDLPHECNVCQRRFAQAAYLKSHIKVHTGEKPFKCEMCGKMFAHQSDVKRHRTTHTGEKPYSCSKCMAKFSDVSSKNRHEREHENNKRYECHLCNDTFKRSGQLRSHLNRKHSHSFALKIEKDSVSGAFTLKMGEEVDPNSIQVTQQRIVSLIKNLHTKTVTEGFTEIENLPVVSMPNNGARSELVTVTSVQGTDISQLEGEVDPSVIEGDMGVPIELQGVEIQGEDASQTYIAITDFADEWVEKETGEGQPTECRYKILYEIGEDGTQKQVLVPFSQMEEEAGTLQVEFTDMVPQITEANQIVTTEEPNISLASTVVEIAGDCEIGSQLSVDQEDESSSYSGPEATSQAVLEKNSQQSLVSYVQEKHVEDQVLEDTHSTHGEKDEHHSAEDGGRDFVTNPDFSSQEYYNWLTNFTELCKVVRMPLDQSLFQKISQVQKTLADVMASPSGVIAERENFRVLMNISKELSTILNEHLVYVLENLNPDEATKEEIENM